jgi:large subunit ribosomal protein L5e
MGLFVKVLKDNTYFKRFQVKFRRRREAKTDYKARRKLIQQDKNKYNTAKYRFVVRITNKDVICQVVHAKIIGDVVMCAAYSHELKAKYGVGVGLTNYAACYATGLLCARRLLQKLGLDSKYTGVTTCDGKFFEIAAAEGKRPFKCILDVGLARTTSGARVFASMKGAVDGGLLIPHSPARFSGYVGSKLDADKHRKRLLGVHVGEYLKMLISEDPEAAKRQFGRYLAAKISSGAVEGVWTECHKAIRKDPTSVKKVSTFAGKPKRFGARPLSVGERLHIRDQRRAAFKRKATAGADEEEADE